MALSTSSRFDFLTDDAGDPYEKKKKPPNPSKNQSKNQSKSQVGANKAKQPPSGNINNSKKKVPASPSSSTNGSQSNAKKVAPAPDLKSCLKSNQSESASRQDLIEKILVASNNAKTPVVTEVKNWEDWEKRDIEFTSQTYDLDLEKALVESKLAFAKEQSRIHDEISSKSKKSKPKKFMPLEMYDGGGGDGSHKLNHTSSFEINDGDEEKLHIEARIEIKRQKEMEFQRKDLLERNAKFTQNPGLAVQELKDDKIQTDTKTVFKENDKYLELLKEKEALEEDVEKHKMRFKKLLELLNDSQLREKVHLIRDLEREKDKNQELTKINQDLNEELRGVYSQLEQERSKSHSAQLEIRRISEISRRRTHSQNEPN